MVIGNTLDRRKYEVIFVVHAPKAVAGGSEDNATNNEVGNEFKGTTDTERWLRIDDQDAAYGKEIEEDIVDELVAMHTRWIGVSASNADGRRA